MHRWYGNHQIKSADRSMAKEDFFPGNIKHNTYGRTFYYLQK